MHDIQNKENIYIGLKTWGFFALVRVAMGPWWEEHRSVVLPGGHGGHCDGHGDGDEDQYDRDAEDLDDQSDGGEDHDDHDAEDYDDQPGHQSDGGQVHDDHDAEDHDDPSDGGEDYDDHGDEDQEGDEQLTHTPGGGLDCLVQSHLS